ncbi:hypothetical protein M407DRAFT_224787 [Tulasnella calospora MUT 4182]|uniref:VWFA domain-containing protein n=1 Tax=Tulasnella calospora MUT 4182 TaxID=1051891 RepID=A0A0C3KBE1_9AGAM|nr:hypothetical protein M407DRAFT_224787 [Tulasnella calospora MUT 4182]
MGPQRAPTLIYQPYFYGTSPYSSILPHSSWAAHQTPFASRSASPQTAAQATASTTAVSNQQDPPSTTGTQTTETHDPNRFDLLPRIKGLYRLLDLYSETGSGGLVDKIIISQESLGRFINSVLPGAYTNVTKIDFSRLDREASLRLVGVYGSKSEIVRFLHSLGSIDDEVAALLLVEDDMSVNMRLSLRSGIYVLSPTAPDDSLAEPLVRYVVYWPEETTWNDDTTGSVRKNRVTFMRYLTALTDQIRALISPEHEGKLVFKDTDQVDDSDEDGFDMSWNDFEAANVDDRLFKFEVAKTNEQAEAVNVRPGFTIAHHAFWTSTVNIPTSSGHMRQELLIPQFVAGETVQAVATTRFVPGVDHTRRLDGSFGEHRFAAELRNYGSIILSHSVDDAGFEILVKKGNLKAQDTAAYAAYRDSVEKAERRIQDEEKEAVENPLAEIRANYPRLRDQVSKYLAPKICDLYPTLVPEDLLPLKAHEEQEGSLQTTDDLGYFYNVCTSYKSADQAVQYALAEAKYGSINYPNFSRLKKRFLIVKGILRKHTDLSEEQRSELANAVSLNGDLPAALKETQTSWAKLNPLHYVKAVALKLNLLKESNDEETLKAYSKVNEPNDTDFLKSLTDTATKEPILAASVLELRELALHGLRQTLESSAKALADKMLSAQEREVREVAKSISKTRFAGARQEATSILRQAIEKRLFREGKHKCLYQIAAKYWQSDFLLKASYNQRSDPSFETSVWSLDLSEDDRQKLKENPLHVPNPRMPRSATKFDLPMGWRIRRIQILGSKKALLVVDCPDRIRLWVFPLRTGFSVDRPTCSIPNVPGRKYVVAVDEQMRLVALAITEPQGNVSLQEFLMDETFSTMHSRGSPLSLNTWYTDGIPEFTHVAFFSGTEELCLVEASGRVRVLSIPSRSFRPATISLPTKPLYVRSSPDGAALLIVEGTQRGPKFLRVFHRASFGSNGSGIVKDLPESFNVTSNFCVSSTGERPKAFLMAFDVTGQRIVSSALEISRKETEYQFRAKDEASNTARETTTVHNSLINCFSEVWERFPVAAAIQRQTLSEDGRRPPRVTFVSSLVSNSFKGYFKRMVQDFERLSRKPTEQRLTRIVVDSSPFDEVGCEAPSTSQYKAGEWIAELLCLIPIHIAVTLENRFVPLKDGVLDSALERELLGAEVSKIIDTISLGWYESIFSSYMANKPVKVVSSMGNKSAGKSYSLNHMVDSSFAGSAVRTTEGVWLSVCPTKDCLVVALDFEGVHSIERTAQEDMLLVLFNTALSNLVIFRNNFALSRDVANMFTSFQASTHLFDPSANQRLFKGLLTIVIKDVVDGDKRDIVKEFFAKFSQIVSKEQATNFITVLHNSQLTVIPWSVIQSREFYALFGKLRNLLFSQKSTHGTAGEFLMTLKTLMAKMKAQDWGSLDQTVIKHRVAALLEMLPAALEYGRSGSTFDADELRNLDDQGVVDHSDHNAKFYIGKDEGERERALASLLEAWGVDPARGTVDEVATHLNDLASSRITHVEKWIEQNLSRFPADNSDIRNLKRDFKDLAERLRNALRLCPAQCNTCQLQCMLNLSHQHQSHDCRTSHMCITPCEYAEEHDRPVLCQLPAGHNGKHVCNPAIHLCGETCYLAGRKGCQGHCSKPSDHEEGEHECSAKVHQCGKPCDLRDMVSSNGQRFSCPLLCAVPHDEPHERHACDNRLACPIRCELCQQYCATGDHFHGLDHSLPHLCGQEHGCRRQCEAAGICEINTTPQSVETTFTGKHSTFSYTKYTQRAKRLDCAIVIPPGKLAHDGRHICTTDPDPFHYCEESCQNCGYICTLPLGHLQPEHDTAHGSMERTAWAVEGNSDAVVEVQGRKFAAQDDGAPQLCSSICRNLGRHAHIDYCRSAKEECKEVGHIDVPMLPNRTRPKDWVSHKVFWERTDPYSNDEQTEFGLCDVQCAGPEHQATATAPARPSFCTLPIFHPPHPINWQAPGNSAYVSGDGHSFGCPNPNNLRQAFHVIFVLDRSGSMSYSDRRPLQGQPVTAKITRSNDNRFGAVLSALYGFWITRGSGTSGPRRDAYSVITFDSYAQTQISNNSTSTSDELLDSLLQLGPRGGTDFDAALRETRTVMVNNWSNDRSPVVVFLSDGECWVNDNTIYDLCNEAVSQGKPVSFHAVSFGQDSSSTPLRRMVTVAERVAQDAPRDPLSPVVPCSYSDAMDTIRLAETFINIADSLKKPRAALLRA